MATSGIDWPHFILRAEQHAVAPLIGSVLGSTQAPADVRGYFVAASQRSGAYVVEQARLAAALRASGITAVIHPVVPLADDAPSATSTLGFVIDERDAGAAAGTLLSHGYASTLRLMDVGETALRRHRSEYVFYRETPLSSDAGTPTVLLTWRPAPRYYPIRSGFTVRSQVEFSVEDRFVYLSLWNTVEVWPHLGRIAQMAQLACAPGGFDWDAVLARGTKMGAERPLRLGIQLSATLLDVPVAPEALRFAMRDSEACRLRDHVERRLFRDRLTAPDPATRARFHLASLATWQDRLSYCMKTMTLLPGHDGARRRPGFVIGHRLLRPARLALQALNARRRPAAIEADFVSMPMEVVDAVLSFARVAGNDVVFDLGCGDGRVVIRAASTYGASGVGIDLDPRALRRAAEAARRAGVQDRASFHRGDIVRADVAGATVIVMWTTAVLTLRIWPVLQRGCAPGTRVVIVNYVMGTWLADRTQAVTDATGATWKMRLYHAQ